MIRAAVGGPPGPARPHPGAAGRTVLPGPRPGLRLPTRVDAEAARGITAAAMVQRPDGGWTDPAQAAGLARAAGLRGPGAGRSGTGPHVELSVRFTTDQLGGPASTVRRRGTDAAPECPRCGGPSPDHDLDVLLGPVGGPTARWAVNDLLARMAWLAATLPELAEAGVDRLVVDRGGACAVGVRVRLAPATLDDPAWRAPG